MVQGNQKCMNMCTKAEAINHAEFQRSHLHSIEENANKFFLKMQKTCPVSQIQAEVISRIMLTLIYVTIIQSLSPMIKFSRKI